MVPLHKVINLKKSKNMEGFKTKTMLCVFVLFTFMLTGCEKEDDLEIIPLENFNGDLKSYLLDNFDINKDGVISLDEADAVTEMHYAGSYGLSSLEGIQYFKNLKIFGYSHFGDKINSFDLSKNTKLEELYCYSSNLTSLDLSKNVALRILECRNNNLTSLVLPESSKLESLNCEYNPNLASLDLSKCTVLKDLKCNDCNISKLDLSSCKELKSLYSSNDFEDVTFADGVKLDELRIGGNALDVRNLNVAKLYCSGAISINASDNVNLKEIVSNGSSLVSLIADGSGLESFSFESNSSYSNLIILYLKNCKKLKSLNINVHDKYGKRGEANIDLDVSGCTALETMTVNYTNSLNATGCTALKYVDCFGMISKATFDGCSALEKLIFSHWAESTLNSLDVNDCKALKNLISYGIFTNLDLSENALLDSLECWAPITDLNISDLSNLRCLRVNSASLSTVDTRKNNSLEELTLYNYSTGESDICDVNVSSSPSLKKIILGHWNDMIRCNVKSLNSENCTSLESIEINGTYGIESLNIKGCYSIKTFSIINSFSLSSLDFSDVASMDSVRVKNTYIQSVKVNENIRVLEIQNNPSLSNLDVSGCRKLEKLMSFDTALNNLELNQCTSLEYLECSENNLTTLDISACTKLITLGCSGNNLTSLDISPCTKLSSLYCQNNKLKGSLDASSCKALSILDCRDNSGLAKLIINKNHSITWLTKDAHTVLELVD